MSLSSVRRVAQFVGPQGPEGPPGPPSPGPIGATGATGPQGPPGATTQFNAYVAVVGPASIAAALNTYYLIDVSGGAVSIITPASGLAAGALFGTKIVKGPVSATDNLTVTAAASSTIEEPLEQSAPLTGVYGANAIFQLPGDLGSSVFWFYDGVSKWGQQ